MIPSGILRGLIPSETNGALGIWTTFKSMSINIFFIKFLELLLISTQKFILMLTPFFGHISFDTHLELMECGSADGAMVISLQESCQ